MDLGERPDPRLDLILEAIHGLGLRKMYRRLNGRENILCPMFSFSSQSGDLPFASLSLRDVLETVDRAEDIAAAIMDRVDVDEHDAAGAVGAFNPDLPVLNGLTVAENVGHWAIGMLHWAAIQMVHTV